MSGNPNLKPLITTANAQEIGSHGGQVISLRKQLNGRQHCEPECALYMQCFMRAGAQEQKKQLIEQQIRQATKEITDEKELKRKTAKIRTTTRVPCRLKKAPEKIQDYMFAFHSEGEEGFHHVMLDVLMRMSEKMEENGGATTVMLERFLSQLRETKKSIYGTKSVSIKQESNADGDSINSIEVKIEGVTAAKAADIVIDMPQNGKEKENI